ncbi:MAG: hypothetical protein J5753_05410 [Oscillospiraceae bacterium]|nr:hypothetical protein [Oscillospiraceae bacterium]
MQEPICLQAEGDNFDPGCAYCFWVTMTFFSGCLGAALWFAGERGGSMMRTGLSVFGIPCVIGGMIHAGTYLARTRVRITATCAGITFEEFCRGKASRTDIPIDEVVNIYHQGKGIEIETVRRIYRVRRLTGADPDSFWLKLKEHVYRYGKAGITDRKWHTSQAMQHDMPRQQPEILPAQQIPLTPVTYQDGEPILPQSLTAEQASGVFLPFQAEPDPQFDVGEEEPAYGKPGDL